MMNDVTPSTIDSQQALLDHLGSRLGLAPQLGQRRQCSMSFDHSLVVTFLAEEGAGLTALSYVMALDDQPPSLWRRWLGLNFLSDGLGGARLSMDTDSNSLVLTREWDAATLGAQEFFSDVEKFVNLVEALRADAQASDMGASEIPISSMAQTSLMSHLVRMA